MVKTTHCLCNTLGSDLCFRFASFGRFEMVDNIRTSDDRFEMVDNIRISDDRSGALQHFIRMLSDAMHDGGWRCHRRRSARRKLR